MLRHPRASSALVGAVSMGIVAWRLGTDAITPIAIFLILSLGLILAIGFYFGLKLAPTRP